MFAFMSWNCKGIVNMANKLGDVYLDSRHAFQFHGLIDVFKATHIILPSEALVFREF